MSIQAVMESSHRMGLATGIKNCHVRGVTSIRFGHNIRMYIASHGHELHRNDGFGLMSLGIHAHHCDVTLIHLDGTPIENILFMPHDEGVPYHRCDYVSGVNNEKGELRNTGVKDRLKMVRRAPLMTHPMLAGQLHTVYLPQKAFSRWIVVEGNEDPNYVSRCWTNNPVFDTEGMYVPMTKDEIDSVLYYA